MPSWAKITSRLAVTPASDRSVLVRWRLSCWDPSGMRVAVMAAARNRAGEKVAHQPNQRRGRSGGLPGSVTAIRER